MAVYLPAYCTREEVKSATDILQSADYDAHIDSAIVAAVPDIDRLCKRRFFNVDETLGWDWPNYQYAYPWRIWFDAAELADVTVNVPVVTSGGVVIPNEQILWGNPRYAPPYRYMELDRSTVAAFGLGETPQRDVLITGTYGYWIWSRPAGALATALSNTTGTAISITDGTDVGVGDTVTIGTERMLVSDRGAFADSGDVATNALGTLAKGDSSISTVVADFNVGEKIMIDSEVMMIDNIGTTLNVTRSYDGTALASHDADAPIYVDRNLVVIRGSFGTIAATHSQGTAITALMVPGSVHELAIAESLNYIAQKTAAYARSIGENATPIPGGGLPDLRKRVQDAYGRKARQRVV